MEGRQIKPKTKISSLIDIDPLLAANSDSLIASQKATKAYVDAIAEVINALLYKGVIDCSANPNYPAADAGHTYVASVAGKIGGALGTPIAVGQLLICNHDSSPSGTQAEVGSYWNIIGGSGSQLMTTKTDPAVNDAVTLAIVDGYAGVIITLTSVGNSQTITNPSNVTPGKPFTVINNETSTAGCNVPVVANGVTYTIPPGKAKSFVWEGTAWVPIDLGITVLPVPVLQGGTELSTITDHAVMVGSGTSPVTPLAVGTTGQVLQGVTGADPAWTSSPSFLGTVTANGFVLGNGTQLTLDPNLTADHTATGWILPAGIPGEALAFGDHCYLASDGKWYKIDCSDPSKMPATAMCVVAAGLAIDVPGAFLLDGYARHDVATWMSLTKGGTIYASTAGGITQTAPSTDTYTIQILGKATSLNSATVGIIRFEPEQVTTVIGLDVVDLGTGAGPFTIAFSGMTAIGKTWMANGASDQTITFLAPTSADVGKRFSITKNGTGAGKVIIQLPAGVYIVGSGVTTTAAGTLSIAASAYGNVNLKVISATVIQIESADAETTFA